MAQTERITLGGGCFWCIEAVYKRTPGIESVTSGYAGGDTENPSYEQICTGKTGHAEVVQVEYDPEQISLRGILDTFWKAHDPTTRNRQGADVGTQYRSIILYENEEQKRIAEESMQDAQGRFDSPIVTELEPLDTFYKAEEYHQDYFEKNPNAGYCRVIINPKLKKLGMT
jgi:peptide-methionine (S)-S-oxide reductase